MKKKDGAQNLKEQWKFAERKRIRNDGGKPWRL